MLRIGTRGGVHFSNTRALVEQGWRAVLIEPHPERHAELAAATSATSGSCAATASMQMTPPISSLRCKLLKYQRGWRRRAVYADARRNPPG